MHCLCIFRFRFGPNCYARVPDGLRTWPANSIRPCRLLLSRYGNIRARSMVSILNFSLWQTHTSGDQLTPYKPGHVTHGWLVRKKSKQPSWYWSVVWIRTWGFDLKWSHIWTFVNVFSNLCSVNRNLWKNMSVNLS